MEELVRERARDVVDEDFGMLRKALFSSRTDVIDIMEEVVRESARVVVDEDLGMLRRARSSSTIDIIDDDWRVRGFTFFSLARNSTLDEDAFMSVAVAEVFEEGKGIRPSLRDDMGKSSEPTRL